MPRRANQTSFKPGRSGNPAGRRPGSKDVMPRVRDLVNAVLEDNVEAVREAYRRAATNPKTVLQCLELAAKLNREVGPGALPIGLDGTGGPRPADGATAGPPTLRIARRPRRTRRTVGRPRAEGQVCRLLNEAFLKSCPEAEAALAECFTNPKTVLACVELLARLNGELP